MNDQTNIPSNIIELIIKEAKGRLTDVERNILDEFLDEHPAMRSAAKHFSKIAMHGAYLPSSKSIDMDKAWENIVAKTREKDHKSKPYVRWLKIAAALAPLLIALGFLFMYFQNKQIIEEQHAEIMSTVRQGRATLVLGSGEQIILDGSVVEDSFEKEGVRIRKESGERISYSDATVASMHALMVPRGGEYQLVLPDGSIVYINSDSKLSYPTVFDTGSRVVSLTGEAYFEVSQDPDRPFIVKTPGMEITVTGTSFNVYNYPGDVAETTLVNGRVEVSSDRQTGIELKPGQQASLSHPSDKVHIREVDASCITSWVHGFFSFRDMKLKDLAIRMERWYDVDISFADAQAEKIRLTGAMEKEKAFEDLVWLIEQSTDVAFDVVENKTVIRMNR